MVVGERVLRDEQMGRKGGTCSKRSEEGGWMEGRGQCCGNRNALSDRRFRDDGCITPSGQARGAPAAGWEVSGRRGMKTLHHPILHARGRGSCRVADGWRGGRLEGGEDCGG